MMRYWGQPYGQHYLAYPGMMSGGYLGIALTIIFWVAILFLFIALIRGFKGHRYEGNFEDGQSGRAIDILKERYAKGEITKKTFEDMKKDIT